MIDFGSILKSFRFAMNVMSRFPSKPKGRNDDPAYYGKGKVVGNYSYSRN